MTYFNQEQIDELTKLIESDIRTTIKLKYKRNTDRKTMNRVVEIYETVTGDKIQNHDWSCALCQYKAIEKIGKLYYESIEYLESLKKLPVSHENDEGLINIHEEENNATDKEKTSKKTRKRKQVTNEK